MNNEHVNDYEYESENEEFECYFDCDCECCGYYIDNNDSCPFM